MHSLSDWLHYYQIRWVPSYYTLSQMSYMHHPPFFSIHNWSPPLHSISESVRYNPHRQYDTPSMSIHILSITPNMQSLRVSTRSLLLPSIQLSKFDQLDECTLWDLVVDQIESPNALQESPILSKPHWSPTKYPIWPRQIGKKYLFDDPVSSHQIVP